MRAPTNPYQPYASQHQNLNGPGDARPTAIEVVKDTKADLRGKIVLITGCSSGIGVETARALHEAGATLFLTARDMPKLEKVIDDIVSKPTIKGIPRPTGIQLRLESLANVRNVAQSFPELSGGKLNILINNAGVMTTPYGKTEDGHETQFGVNHLAPFLLFQLLKPLLVKSAKESNTTSRIINLSSSGHRVAPINWNNHNFEPESSYNKYVAYSQAKTANIYMTNAITRYYATQGLTGLSVHPGIIMTELVRHWGKEDWDNMGDLDAVRIVQKSPEQGAATTVWAAVDSYFEDVKNGGKFLGDVGEAREEREGDTSDVASYAKWAYDVEGEDRLWKVSNELVGLLDEEV